MMAAGKSRHLVGKIVKNIDDHNQHLKLKMSDFALKRKERLNALKRTLNKNSQPEVNVARCSRLGYQDVESRSSYCVYRLFQL